MKTDAIIKQDCYALRHNGERAFCDVLDDLVCRKRNCSFYTNKHEHEDTAKRASERNERLFPKGYKPRNMKRTEANHETTND